MPEACYQVIHARTSQRARAIINYRLRNPRGKMSAKKVRKGYTVVGPQEPIRYGTGYDLYTVPRHRLTSPI